MSILRDFAATLHKMFAADLIMTVLALSTVVMCAVAKGMMGRTALPFVLVSGVAAALVIAVLRGSRPPEGKSR